MRLTASDLYCPKFIIFLSDSHLLEVPEVVSFFGGLGAVSAITTGKKSATPSGAPSHMFYMVHYSTPKEARAVVERLRHSHPSSYPRGVFLPVSMMRPPTQAERAERDRIDRRFEQVAEPDCKVKPEEVQEALEGLSEGAKVSEQMRRLAEAVRMRPEEFASRAEMCRHLEATFLRLIPGGVKGCRVVPFGSTVNGLGFRGCDLDLYVDMGTAKKMFLQ